MQKVFLTALVSVFVLTGCNTLRGFRQDVSEARDKVNNTFHKVKKEVKEEIKE